jgi:Fur family iron response transcriptional regulator
MSTILPFAAPLHAGKHTAMPDLPACPFARVRLRLRDAGLRPTRQRVLLGMLLFGKGDRHTCAEDLFRESREMRADLSLATVYNTLKQFSDAGILRKVASVGDRMIYDTNTGDHHHFLVENEGLVFDVDASDLPLPVLPEPPKGFRLVGVDVVVRLERINERQA